ncbi:hypothetical protein HZZ13_23455 [Bradyrhizobium sp. CNPSo 4010]|uniref:Uncharacterized protein n=1 Tax=Bradyrhizobium agreste TaxID=2751811 RepID=A0ABS0PUE5_9BRAD|nr:hypothetical protein [Bradyrhizobium agreste]MBH5400720.1 hypothetical protein [Bradyrhizobium agreste]
MIPLWTTATFPSYAVGAPATKTGILSASASMLLYGAAAPFGDDCIAARGIAVRLLPIGALHYHQLFYGLSSCSGFRLFKAATLMLSMTVALSVVSSAAVVSFTQPLVKLFSDSGNVTEIAASICIVFHFF